MTLRLHPLVPILGGIAALVAGIALGATGAGLLTVLFAGLALVAAILILALPFTRAVVLRRGQGSVRTRQEAVNIVTEPSDLTTELDVGVRAGRTTDGGRKVSTKRT